jgi:uncharacterized NAD(P)/FAD-binding protein YdhS
MPLSAAVQSTQASGPSEAVQDICVVGGGFSGCAVAANLLVRSEGHRAPLRVHLIERRPDLGRGAAYATREAVHLLNVPARGMSAWTDKPEDFLDWVRSRMPEAKSGDFLQRRLYADYLLDTLARAEVAARGRCELDRVQDEAMHAVQRSDGSWEVQLASGRVIACEAIVLATGHRAPGDPLGGRWTGSTDRWIGDPWRPGATEPIGADESVVIVGAGLTAMDQLLSLAARQPDRKGPITVISRSGLMPAVHASTMQPPVDPMPMLNDLALSGRVTSVRGLLRAVRRAIRGSAGAPPQDWRAVIDGLRPYTHGLWSALSQAEKRRFIRHLRPIWDAHRHRMAPEIGARIEALRARGFFTAVRGRIRAGEADANALRLRVEVFHRGAPSTERTIEARWAINCTGPSPSVGHAEDRFAASLIDAGLARMDPIGLGLETDPIGRPLARSGRSSGGLWVIGSLRRPALWETTAVPELRAQAESVARDCLQALA